MYVRTWNNDPHLQSPSPSGLSISKHLPRSDFLETLLNYLNTLSKLKGRANAKPINESVLNL